ncbi:MAG: hypothetical protein HFJ34_03465 [Clostridia bacterium]|nr:hypothetical protein [Clostridia bacterium]
MKKILYGIILIAIIIVVIVVVIKTNNSNDMNKNEQNIESVVTKTVEIEGKKAKYTLLENEDSTIYGIQFENTDLMTKIEIVKRGSIEDIKNLIKNDSYKFTTDGVYKLNIETVDGTRITTTTFKVVAQK